MKRRNSDRTYKILCYTVPLTVEVFECSDVSTEFFVEFTAMHPICFAHYGHAEFSNGIGCCSGQHLSQYDINDIQSMNTSCRNIYFCPCKGTDSELLVAYLSETASTVS